MRLLRKYRRRYRNERNRSQLCRGHCQQINVVGKSNQVTKGFSHVKSSQISPLNAGPLDFGAFIHDGGVEPVAEAGGKLVDLVGAVDLDGLSRGVEDDFAVAALPMWRLNSARVSAATVSSMRSSSRARNSVQVIRSALAFPSEFRTRLIVLESRRRSCVEVAAQAARAIAAGRAAGAT